MAMIDNLSKGKILLVRQYDAWKFNKNKQAKLQIIAGDLIVEPYRKQIIANSTITNFSMVQFIYHLKTTSDNYWFIQ